MSSYNSKKTNQLRGQDCEHLALKYYQNKSYEIIGRNQKWAQVEIDLLLYKQHYVLIEVKAIRSFDEVHFRLSLGQKKRLLFVRQCLEDKFGESVELRVLYVKNAKEMIELSIEDH